MYLEEVKGSLLLELAVVFGISALVTSFLKHKHDVEFAGISLVLQVNPQPVSQPQLL